MSSKEIFTPDSKTLRKIFGDTDAFYSVPDYQRPYRWQDEQVEQLWEDLYSSFTNWKDQKDENDSYFLGSIILIKGEDHYDLVDGQQRLTTLTIFFSVVRDLFPELNLKTVNTVKNSIKNIIDGKQRLRFTTAIDKQNEFEQTIINGIKFPEKFTASDKKKRPYINTALMFREKLLGIKAEEVEQFVNYIFDHVCLISITCHSPSFAIRLFQVLNARGLDLSAADLIKSHLMNKLPDEKQREQFIANWRQIEGVAADVSAEMDELLNYYLYCLKGANPEKGLFEEMTKLLEGRDSNSVVFELKKL